MERRSIPKKSRRGRFQRKLEKATIAAYARGLNDGRREVLTTRQNVALAWHTRECADLARPYKATTLTQLRARGYVDEMQYSRGPGFMGACTARVKSVLAKGIQDFFTTETGVEPETGVAFITATAYIRKTAPGVSDSGVALFDDVTQRFHSAQADAPSQILGLDRLCSDG